MTRTTTDTDQPGLQCRFHPPSHMTSQMTHSWHDSQQWHVMFDVSGQSSQAINAAIYLVIIISWREIELIHFMMVCANFPALWQNHVLCLFQLFFESIPSFDLSSNGQWVADMDAGDEESMARNKWWWWWWWWAGGESELGAGRAADNWLGLRLFRYRTVFLIRLSHKNIPGEEVVSMKTW